MDEKKIDVVVYADSNGREPFSQWFRKLGKKHRTEAARIIARIDKLEKGLWGDWVDVGEGVTELKLDFGPGYRLYVGNRGAVLVVLLCGGDKRTQDRDIERAQDYWTDYRRREK